MGSLRSQWCERNSEAVMSELLDRALVCRYFGGSKPINLSTLYRRIRQGRYPKPVKVGPVASRWLRDQCEAALQATSDCCAEAGCHQEIAGGDPQCQQPGDRQVSGRPVMLRSGRTTIST